MCANEDSFDKIFASRTTDRVSQQEVYWARQVMTPAQEGAGRYDKVMTPAQENGGRYDKIMITRLVHGKDR